MPLGWLPLPPNCSLRNIWGRMELKKALTMMTMNMDGSDEVQIYINCRCINIKNKSYLLCRVGLGVAVDEP